MSAPERVSDRFRFRPASTSQRVAPAGGPALAVRGFSFWYGTTQALHDVSLEVPRHSVTALIGVAAQQKTPGS